MDAAARETQARKFIEEVWNGKNYQAASDLYADEYVNPFGTGPAARAEPIRRYHQAFPDLHIDIEELIAAGDTVVLGAAFRGTDTGGYAGRAAAGRAVGEWAVTIMHFGGDNVVRDGPEPTSSACSSSSASSTTRGSARTPLNNWDHPWQGGRWPAGAVPDGASGTGCLGLGAQWGRPFADNSGQVRSPFPIARRCPALTPASRPMIEAVTFACRAPLLDIFRHTASTHLRHIFAKLRLPDRTGRACRRGRSLDQVMFPPAACRHYRWRAVRCVRGSRAARPG